MPNVGIALGSNLGDRLANLRKAVTLIRSIMDPDQRMLESAVFETDPVACPPNSPAFLNAVIEIGYRGTSLELLEQTRGIERQLGRTLSLCRNEPRTIDLDILYFGDETRSEDPLILPHPRLHERRFVLEPLSMVRPDLRLNGTNRCAWEILSGLPNDAPLRQIATQISL